MRDWRDCMQWLTRHRPPRWACREMAQVAMVSEMDPRRMLMKTCSAPRLSTAALHRVLEERSLSRKLTKRVCLCIIRPSHLNERHAFNKPTKHGKPNLKLTHHPAPRAPASDRLETVGSLRTKVLPPLLFGCNRPRRRMLRKPIRRELL